MIKLKELLKEKVYSIDTSKNPNIIIGDLYDSLFQFQKKKRFGNTLQKIGNLILTTYQKQSH